MMKAKDILPEFTARIETDAFFEDIEILRAFPPSVKPTLLKKAVVAVGLKSIDADEEAIGQDVITGSYSVSSDIYVPYSYDKSRFEQIVFRICADIADLNIVSIGISEVFADSMAECFVMKTVFTFRDELCFKDDVYE